jgi:hypothetical protein
VDSGFDYGGYAGESGVCVVPATSAVSVGNNGGAIAGAGGDGSVTLTYYA